jgi:4-diphosphocytidyl-2-C-methyl-D-erythritol kinase
MKEAVRVLCPAKVNLYLKVLGKRPDGYHELVTVLQPLSLADELTVSLGGGGISLECEAPGLPRDESNLVWQAALRFEEASGLKLRVRFRLRKRIPVAAGLGGGSSDAAGALLALNAAAGRPLGAADLKRLAAGLGADVPFFLSREPQVGRGIGADLAPLALPPFGYLLLNPGLPLSTRWVYENLDLKELTSRPEHDTWDPEHPEQWVANDLAGVALRRFPALGEMLGRLKSLGALAQDVSGSGPTLFGLFATPEAAREAGRLLKPDFAGWLAAARGLTGRERDAAWEKQVWMI